ncbi:MAG: hypothetical protein MUF31_00175 [Akkermansiaceae bacterium]|nr:hypothetical protein [Akkermansiaceae bacterium]
MIPNPQPPALPPMHLQVQSRDAEHIRLLSLFHYIFAGLSLVGGLLFVLYIAMAIMMMRGFSTMSSSSPGAGAPPAGMFEMIGVVYLVMGILGCLAALAMGVGSFFAAKGLAERRRRTFIYVVSAFQCLLMPLGTVLGIFTILVLERPSVRALFASPSDELSRAGGGGVG